MEQNYLVGSRDSQFEDQDFKVVVAASPEEAVSEFVKRVGIKEEGFLEHLYGKSINASFAEHFWLQTPEENEQLERTGTSDLSEDDLEKRVREFFGPHDEFADLYLAFYFGDDEEGAHPEFPEEMLLYIWQNSNWSELVAINIMDIERL